MTPVLKRFLFIGLACLGLAACGGSDSDDMGDTDGVPGASDSPGDAGGTSMPAPGTTPGAPVSFFDGAWESNCAQELSVAGVSEYQTILLQVSGDTYTRTINSYTDSDCSVASVPAVAVSEHSLVFPDGEATTTQGPAGYVDVTMESIEVDGVDVSAFQQALGFETEYNIFVVGVDGRLYFGDPALSASERPTTLNTAVYFEAR